MSREMTYEEWRVVASGYEAMVMRAVPGLNSYDVRVSQGEKGLPHRLEVTGVLAERTTETGTVVPQAFTFFDGGDIKRIALALGRSRQAHFENRRRHALAVAEAMSAAAEAQAAALAAIEGEATA